MEVEDEANPEENRLKKWRGKKTKTKHGPNYVTSFESFNNKIANKLAPSVNFSVGEDNRGTWFLKMGFEGKLLLESKSWLYNLAV